MTVIKRNALVSYSARQMFELVNHIEDYPRTYQLYSNEISLPIYPQLTNDQCKMVTDAVTGSVKKIF